MSDEGEVICGTAEVERIAEQIRSKQHRLQIPEPGLERRLPVGAELLSHPNRPAGRAGAHFRVWAPESPRVEVELFTSVESTEPTHTSALRAEENGYFSGTVAEAREGSLYKYRLDTGSFPDPASRFQPAGPHGPSQVIDPARFQWTDHGWRGVAREGQVIYEMHLGTFTREGTWRAAIEQLPELARLGITVIEVLPIADFPGRFGWGYDGVNLFAPTRLYGSPDDARAFVDRAHALGIGVILDVVYNHLGPDGNYLSTYSPDYFSNHYECEWGDALNFDGENSGPVREFFIANAGYWIDEFHFDGLRLDATQQIFDKSDEHVLLAISRRLRDAARGRTTYLVAENECQHARLVRSGKARGYELDALWNDDFHHSAIVAATGRNEAYYTDYKGTPQEFISAIKWGYLYQGQWYQWQEQRRGTPALDLAAPNFVNFLQNHDQVANSLRGHRLHQLTSPGRFKALTALLLLGPNTPMLFQGQEFAASTPFHYFADHNPELAKLVAKGRREFMHQFKSIACAECDAILPNPESEETFRRSVLDFSERQKHAPIYELHRELLRLRREDPVFSRCARQSGRTSHFIDGAVLAGEAFVIRFFGEGEDRLLIVNLGIDLHLCPVPEPLLAPMEGCRWGTLLSTENVCFGGCGAPPVESEKGWCIPGHAAVVLGPETLEG